MYQNNLISDPVANFTPGNILDFTAIGQKYGKAPALVWRNETISYRQYAERVTATADWLNDHNISANHRIVIDPHLDPLVWTVTFFAVLSVGAVAVLLPARCTAREKIKMMATTAAILPPITPNYDYNSGRPALINIKRPATIIFTSGSSGNAKAVVHSTANHLYSAVGSSINIPIKQGDSWLITLPLQHVAGLSILFRTLTAGACAVIAQNGSLQNTDDDAILLLSRVTHVSLVETQLHRLMQLRPSKDTTKHLRTVLIGGSSISQSLLRTARSSGIPVCASYGCTEMASQVATTDPFDNSETFENCGSILPYREVSIGQQKEILLRGKTLCIGYQQRHQIIPINSNNRWWFSGDIGQIKGPKLSVIGRIDARFISGGENIQPEEVEQALLEHPSIITAICVAVPDEEYGNRPVAFISLNSGSFPPSNIEDHLNTRVARFKHPILYLRFPSNSEKLSSIKHSRIELTKYALQKRLS